MASSPRSLISTLLDLEARQKLEHYVRERQKEEGGFGLTPLLPATVTDTFFTVRILEMIDQDEELEKTKSYLHRTDWHISTRVKVLYQVAYLRRKFGLLEQGSPPPTPSRPMSLERAFYWKKIMRLWGNLYPRPGYPLGWEQLSPKLPAAPTVKDLCYYLDLQHHLSFRQVAAWLKWVQACQSPDGGFGFRPGTTSFMDNVAPALEILSRFHLVPLDSHRLISFILGCQTRDGGFARKNGGVAFLESSYYAVKSLHLLSSARLSRSRLHFPGVCQMVLEPITACYY